VNLRQVTSLVNFTGAFLLGTGIGLWTEKHNPVLGIPLVIGGALLMVPSLTLLALSLYRRVQVSRQRCCVACRNLCRRDLEPAAGPLWLCSSEADCLARSGLASARGRAVR
jgi:hypothetical protein